MVDYAGLATTASALLAEFGQLVTITRRTVSSFNPVTGVETLGTATQFTGYGAGFNYKKAEIDGTVIMQGDLNLTLESTATVPAVGDVVTYQTIAYRVMDVETLSPGGTTLIYKLQLRK